MDEKITNAEILCQHCGAANTSDSQFCFSCGKEVKTVESNAPAFAPVAQEVVSAKAEAKEAVPVVKKGKYVEPDNAFAQGLPSWDVVPPQIVVRRR